MKYIALIICVMASLSFTNQPTKLEPVKWRFYTEKIDGSNYLVMKATIDDGWKMYGSFPTAGVEFEPCNGDLGPTCLDVTFEEGQVFLIDGVEGIKAAKKSYDKVFKGDITYYTNAVELRQKIKNAPNNVIKGYVYFMSCNDEKCMPPKYVDFEVAI